MLVNNEELSCNISTAATKNIFCITKDKLRSASINSRLATDFSLEVNSLRSLHRDVSRKKVKNRKRLGVRRNYNLNRNNGDSLLKLHPNDRSAFPNLPIFHFTLPEKIMSYLRNSQSGPIISFDTVAQILRDQTC
jgi:hypothetical protein